MSTNELDIDIDLDTEDDFNKKPKCKKCGRFIFGHTQPYGPKCTMKRKREEEIEAENQETLEKRRKMMKEKREKETADNQTIPVPVTTVYTGYGSPVTTGAPTTTASTVPINTVGGVDPNMATFIQQMMTQQNQQMSTFMTTMFQNMSQGSGGMNLPANHGYKLPVPEWNKDMSFEAWKRNILMFRDQSPMNETQKLTMILESLKKNKEREEIKDWIIQEIDEDITFDKNHADAISNLIEKMKGKFEVSRWKKTGEIWEELIKFQIKEDETPKQYLSRFKQLESKIKNAKTSISPHYLAQHFLSRANLDPLTVQSIIAMVDLEKDEEVLEEIQKKYENVVVAQKDKKAFYGTGYRRRSQSSTFRESREPRGDDRKFRPRSRSASQHRGRFRSRSQSRGRSRYDHSRHEQREETTYVCEKFQLGGTEINNNENNIYFTGTVNKSVVDSGCPLTVTGSLWFSAFRDSLRSQGKSNEIEESPCNVNFRFGPSNVYNARKEVSIPIKLGQEITRIRVKVVNANIPLLIGKDVLKYWKASFDFDNSILRVFKRYNVQLHEDESGHYLIEHIDDLQLVKDNIKNSYFTSGETERYEEVKRIHRATGHKSEISMKRLFKEAGKSDTKTNKVISEVVDNCKTCRVFKKTNPRPKVSLRKSNDFNSVVSLDLKQLPKQNKYILYCLCEFSGFIKGIVIKNKEATTVLENFERIWVLQGPGMPSKAIFSDRGLEFLNKKMHDFCKQNNIKHLTTAGYSPWSNGKNERGHSVADMAMQKVQEEDKSISVEEAVDRACYSKNIEIGRLGFSPLQIAHGRSPFIPGVSEGNLNTDEIPESELVERIMKRQMKVREEFRKADSSDRLKRLMKERLYQYKDSVYEPGSKVYIQDRITGRWDGPAIVKFHQGNEVKVTMDRSELSVSNTRVRPYEDKVIESEEEADLDEKVNEEKDEEVDEKESIEEDNKEGNDEKKDETEQPLRKSLRIKNAKGVKFAQIEKEAKRFIKEDDSEGVKYLFFTNMMKNSVETINEEEVYEIFATEIPSKQQNTPEIIAAKQVEYDNYVKFNAFEEIEDIGQEKLKTRWVCSKKEKQDGLKVDYKARLVVKGFMEQAYPRSDSPTIAKESLKTLFAVAANEGFDIVNLDIRNGYLQGSDLKREVFVEPPPEYKKEGMIWKLKKAANGLYDGGRHLYLKIDEVLKELGCTKVTGDDAMYTCHDETKKLIGIVSLYVDDFNSAGTKDFHKKVTDPLQKRFTFGKKEEGSFRFTGLDILHREDGIVVKQNDYRDSLEEVEIDNNDDPNRELNLKEYKQFRGIVGKLQWLSEGTRPDLAYDTLSMSMKTKHAKVADMRKLNKIVKKAREGDSVVTFKKVGKMEDLKIIAMSDASFKSVDDKVRSVEGRVIFLSDGVRASPLEWKSKKIPQVCESTKTAETRAADKATDDAIYFARLIKEIYTGVKSLDQLPVIVYTDSRPTIESIYSTRQVDRKTVRHVIQSMKDALERGEVSEFKYSNTKEMLADVLTKDSVRNTELHDTVKSGSFPRKY